ncbi:hypothetical protein BH11PSE4_BH11PSE4_04470 [soil metagenome]
MTIYYFDVKNGTTERDHAGAEFDSDDQAIDRAHTIADGMSHAKPRRHACHISVIRGDGREVVQVQVSEEVGVDPSAAP